MSGDWAADIADRAMFGDVLDSSDEEGVSRAHIEPPFVISGRSVRTPGHSNSSNKQTPTPVGNRNALTSVNATSNNSNTDLLSGARFGDWLCEQAFPPLRFAVPDIVPAGFTLLAGPPKAGKSWLLLDWLIALATGGRALGSIAVGEPRQVFYMALEDSDRRMQERCSHLLRGRGKLPAKFAYLTRCHPHQAMATVEAFMEKYPDTGLVAIDTLGRVMPPMMSGETTYQRDYRVGATLQSLAEDHPGLGIVVAHHTRKTVSADFVDSVSGTNGLAGAADTIVVLSRDRNTSDGILNVTGRDVEEAEYALVSDCGRWMTDGADLSESIAAAQDRKSIDNLGGVSNSILDYFADHPEGLRAREIAEKFGKSAYTYLTRLADSGHLDKLERGLYTLATERKVA